MAPGALADDLLERNPVTGATPRGDDDVRVGVANDVGASVLAGLTNKFSTGGFDQFCYPELRVNDGLAPFFAEDVGARSRWVERADFGNRVLHSRDDSGGSMWFAEYAGDERDVGVNVGKAARGQK